jgi:hypothetical protein
MDMSLSVTGWAVDPELLSDIRYELIHSDTSGDCFRIKMEFKNGTDALIDIEIKEGTGLDTYELLTEAIRTRRVQDTLTVQSEESDP